MTVIEQHRILRHDADVGTQTVLRDPADVLAIDADLTCRGIVKTKQQAYQR